MVNNNVQPVYISFVAEITQLTVEHLMSTFADKVNNGVREVHLLFSSQGGSVALGITLYNFLRSLPINLITHNVGVVNSIANVIFLAGTNRYANYNSSFLFHGVGFDITNPLRLEEAQLKERLDSVEKDHATIANIITERTNLSTDAIKKLFLKVETKDPAQAKKAGIIHDVSDVNIPKGAEVTQLVFKR